MTNYNKLLYHPLDQFEILPIFLIQHGIHLPVGITVITNLTVMLILNVCLFRILLGHIFDKNLFNVGEFILQQIYSLVKSIIKSNTTLKRYQYFAVLFFLFSFILIANLVGLIPYS